jgi:hypothetical protein
MVGRLLPVQMVGRIFFFEINRGQFGGMGSGSPTTPLLTPFILSPHFTNYNNQPHSLLQSVCLMASRVLTSAQENWLKGSNEVLQQYFETVLEPPNDPRSELQIVMDHDHFLRNIHITHNGMIRQAISMNLTQEQFPNIYDKWVQFRAKKGKGNFINDSVLPMSKS